MTKTSEMNTPILIKTYDLEGRCNGEGFIDAADDSPRQRGNPLLDVATHGSISIEIGRGRWLNILSSEWLTITVNDKPEHWENIE